MYSMSKSSAPSSNLYLANTFRMSACSVGTQLNHVTGCGPPISQRAKLAPLPRPGVGVTDAPESSEARRLIEMPWM